ncbi:MAG TPA: hypothetical protein PKD90_03490 [Phnomibacter sp.]|mgnify:CR=1 FL=1|nr:hypothetical protein [Phnomibacter sp.]
MDIRQVNKLLQRISANVLATEFNIIVSPDKQYANGRLYLQVQYEAPCTHTGAIKQWHGRKWYLSQYMTDDEIIKTAYAALEAAVKHEVMEGFKIDGRILFNPHTSYQALLMASKYTVSRQLK